LLSLLISFLACLVRPLKQQAVVPTRGEDISPEYVALEAKRNAYGELKKLLVSGIRSAPCASDSVVERVCIEELQRLTLTFVFPRCCPVSSFL